MQALFIYLIHTQVILIPIVPNFQLILLITRLFRLNTSKNRYVLSANDPKKKLF